MEEILHSFDGGKTRIVSEVLEVNGIEIRIKQVEKISEFDSEMLIDQEEKMLNITNSKFEAYFSNMQMILSLIFSLIGPENN